MITTIRIMFITHCKDDNIPFIDNFKQPLTLIHE